MAATPLVHALAALLGAEHVVRDVPVAALRDATEFQGLSGEADALVRPGSAEEVAAVLAWCYEHDVAITPRGGGTGYAGGAVPRGGIVLSLDRLTRVRALDPLQWRMHVEAGLTTAHVQRLARENGLLFPPDPGAAESSHIGGNIATNAGGPHAFKYGVTRRWVTGLEVAIAPGELITVGGPVRKDAAGYDLVGLLSGSEGTLGILTAAWVALLPRPATVRTVLALYPSLASGCDALERVLGAGLRPAALEYFDGGALEAARESLPGGRPEGVAFAILAEADGEEGEVRALATELLEALGPTALRAEGVEADALWRWRAGASSAVATHRGGKVSEDIAVPVERLAEAIAETVEIGARHGLPACSWGHAGDGNLHSTLLVDRGDPAELHRAERAAHELLELALRLGGTISGEHGVGMLKRSHLPAQLGVAGHALQRRIKVAWDPKGLLNPGKKLA